MSNRTKIIFFGTPQFAVPFFNSISTDAAFEIVGVVTQPDKPVGRKQIITPPPIKEAAVAKNIPVFQPEKLKSDINIINNLKQLNPNLAIVVAFGQIIPQEILNIFPNGNINVHPSLLPKYRGASPIQSAILNGDEKTGITIMLMDEKMDHGPILAQQEIILDGNETNESLHNLAAELGKNFLIETVKKYLAKEIEPQEQTHEAATFCQSINKDEAKINWSQSAKAINQKIRAFYPWPVAWTTLDDKRLKIFPPAIIISDKKSSGEIFLVDNKLAVSCGEQAITLKKIQLEGKREMTAEEFLAGNHDIVGKILK